MQTRIVHTKVWKDNWFANLSKEAKYLWLYLLTCEKINISGVFELSDREILFDTSLDASVLTSIKEELKPKAIFVDGWVRVSNVEKYNKYLNSPSNVIACEREVTYIPEKIMTDLGILSDTSVYTDPTLLGIRNKESGIKNKEQGTGNQESEKEKEERREKRKEMIYKKMRWTLK